MASPVKVTTAGNPAAITSGSSERILDRAADGTLWLQLLDGGDDGRFWYSKNQGTTWSYSGEGSDLDDVIVSSPGAFKIDAEGYAHSVVRRNNTTLRYYRGVPGTTAGITWKWTHIDFAPSTEALAPDSGINLVVFKVGAGWKGWVLAGTTLRDGAGNYTNTLRLTQVDISSSGGLSINNTQTIVADTGGQYPHGALAFQHTGDGKTSTATPHVYVVTAVNTPTIVSTSQQDPLQLYKLTYQAGAWTLGAPVTLDAATDTTGRTLSVVYDGARVVAAYGTRDRSVGTSSAAVKVVEWVEATGTVTQRNPPAYGGGYPLGTSLAVDPISDDLFVVAYGETNDDPTWTRFTRSGTTWAAWSTVTAASMNGKPGRVSMKAYVSSSAIELVYLTGTTAPYTVNYVKLTSINRAPAPPSLLAPAASSVSDLGTYGITFGWSFNDPDPGDTQGAWQMRRKTTVAGSYTYLNSASNTWGSTAVWNTGAAQTRSFAPGDWPNGVTYQWSVNTQDAGGLISGFAPDSLVTASLSPVATVLAPIAAYTQDSSPIVTWQYVSANPQRTYQLKVFDLATYTAGGFDPATSTPVWDSGEVASVQARLVRIGLSLLNGGTYRSYLRVSDSLSLYSQWTYGEFVLILTPAPAPALEAIEETNFATGLKRVRLTVQGFTNMLSASQAYDHTFSSTDWTNDANANIALATTGAATVAGRSLQLTAIGSGDMRVRSSAGVAPVDTTGAVIGPARDFAAAALETYTAVASFTASGAPRLCRLTLRFYSPADVLLLSVSGSPVADLTGFPTMMTVTGTAPLNTDRVRLVLEVLSCPPGDIHYVDRIDLHPGTLADYAPGGLTTAQAFTVYRNVPGETSTPVRTATAVTSDTNQHLITFDREMPLNVPVSYTAQAITILTSGQPLASDPSPAAEVTVASEVWGLRDPLDPDAEARALVTEHETETTELAAVYRPAGRSYPLVETEGVQGEDGTKLMVFVDTIADRQNLRGLLHRPASMILQSPSGDYWYVRFTDRKMVATHGLGQSWELVYVQVAAP